MSIVGPRARASLVWLSLAACASDRAVTPAEPPEDDDMGVPAPGEQPSTAVLAAAPEATAPPAEDARPPRTIFRAELQRATERGPAHLLRQLGPEPFRHHGTFVGWELTRLFPDDPHVCASGCDIAVGDVILSVNGSRLETPQQLSDAFAGLPKTDRLVVHSLREGKRRERTYRIVDVTP